MIAAVAGLAVQRRGRIGVTGASSPVAAFLLPRLLNDGHAVTALSRGTAPAAAPAGVAWVQADLQGDAPLPPLPGVQALVHLAPLWLLPPHVAAFSAMGVRRIVAFGSTSRFTKAHSASDAERHLAARLAAAEGALAAACHEHAVAWTVFRPTLTYGSGRDGNIAFIARFVRRFGFFPLAGRAEGLRQPVHADDLAAACVAALQCPATCNRAYNLPGGQALSYRRMVEAVFRAGGRTPRFVSLPLPLWRAAMSALALLPRAPRVGLEMAVRMNADMVFDFEEARRDFGYAPRPFQP